MNLSSPGWVLGSLKHPLPILFILKESEGQEPDSSWVMCAFSPKYSEGGRSSFLASSEEQSWVVPIWFVTSFGSTGGE